MLYKLSVFSTIVQAIKLFWLSIGKLCLWALIPALLITGVIAVVGMARTLTSNWGIHPFVEETSTELFAFIISVPFFLRVNQLVILGRVMDNGYFRAIFSPRCVSFLGYTLIVGLIYVAITVFSGIFNEWAGKAGLGATLFLVVKLTVVAFFFIMVTPATLIFPIVSVEESASFSRTEELGSGNRLRLFVTIFPCWFLVTAISVCLVTAISTMLKAIGEPDPFWSQQSLGIGTIPLFVVLLLPVSIMQVHDILAIALPAWLAIALPAWLAIALPAWLASDISMELLGMIYRSFSFYSFQQALDKLLITIPFCTFQTWLVLLFQAAVTTIPAVAYRQLRDQPAAAGQKPPKSDPNP